MAVTLGGNVPLNRAMLTWAPHSPPLRWQEDVARWDRFDTIRSLTAVGALVMQSFAVWQRTTGA